MKVHIGLSAALAASAKAMPDQQAGQFLASSLGVSTVDTKRLKRFGIVSAECEGIDPKQIEDVHGVDWVEVDRQRSAI